MNETATPERPATRDLALAGRVLAGALVAWLVPERFWAPVTGAVGRLSERLSPTADEGPGSGRADSTGSDGHGTRRAVAMERIEAGHTARLYGLREYRPGRNRPRFVLKGADRLRHALESGNGAILWVARFAFAPLLSKIALHDAGFSVSHLSRPTHGFGTSPFAVRWLNPIWTRIEERYVHERVVMQPGAETAALRTLRRRLKENRVVSITVGDEAVKTVSVPFRGGRLSLATGPISLALASGAPLLPMFAVRVADRAFAIEIQERLDLSNGGDRDDLIVAAAEQYADRLAPVVRIYPGQWIP